MQKEHSLAKIGSGTAENGPKFGEHLTTPVKIWHFRSARSRFFAQGLACLDSLWVRFDFFLVVVSWINRLFIEPWADELGPASQVAGPFIVLRILRCVKALR